MGLFDDLPAAATQAAGGVFSDLPDAAPTADRNGKGTADGLFGDLPESRAPVIGKLIPFQPGQPFNAAASPVAPIPGYAPGPDPSLDLGAARTGPEMLTGNPVQLVTKPLGYAGNVARGAVADLAVGMAPSTEIQGNTLEALKGARRLPIDQSLAEAEQVDTERGAFPTAALAGEISQGLAQAAPKMAVIAATGGAGLPAQMVASGGLFGVDDDGNFSPKDAAFGALLPGVGKVARTAAAKALGAALAGGVKALENPLAQKAMELAADNAAVGAWMLAQNSGELEQAHAEDPAKFRQELAKIVGTQLAFGLMGVKSMADPRVPSVTQERLRSLASDVAGRMVDNPEYAREIARAAEGQTFGQENNTPTPNPEANAEPRATVGTPITEGVSPERPGMTTQPAADLFADLPAIPRTPTEAELEGLRTAFDPNQVAIAEVPVKELKLSADVPNFKADANSETGVVAGQKLEGKFQRLGTGPIVAWRRLNGDLEVITGRHRLDLARRSGETTIPAQVVEEANGFTKEMALTFDAEANIRDGQGSVEDYGTYFRHSPQLTEEAAKSRGLLSRAKGQAGFDLGRYASDDVYALWKSGKVTEGQALAITRAAPGDAAAQRVGSRQALLGKSPEFISDLITAARSTGRAVTPDLFGANDAALQEAEALAQRVGRIKSELRGQIQAVQGAAKRPEQARKLGVNVEDPQGVKARIGELRAELERWEGNWAGQPDLMARARGASQAPASIQGEVPGRPRVAQMSSLFGDLPTRSAAPTMEDLAQREVVFRERLSQPGADQAYDALPESRGGKVVGTDIVRLMQSGAETREGRIRYGAAGQRPAREWADARILRDVGQDGRGRKLLINAGGIGTGKSSMLTDAVLAKVDKVWDTTLRNRNLAERVIEKAIAHGWEVQVNYVHRPAETAVPAVLERSHSEGRVVNLAEVPQSGREAQDSVLALQETFRKTPGVEFAYYSNPGRGGKFEALRPVAEAALAKGGEAWYSITKKGIERDERIAKQHWEQAAASGRIEPAVIRQSGRPKWGQGQLAGGAEPRNPDNQPGNPTPSGNGSAGSSGAGQVEPIAEPDTAAANLGHPAEESPLGRTLGFGGTVIRSRSAPEPETPTTPEAVVAVQKRYTPGLAGNIRDGILSLLLPSAKSSANLKAAELLGSKLGPMHHRGEVAAAKLRPYSKQFDKLGVHREDLAPADNPGIKFMSDMSQGRPTGRFQAAAAAINRLFEQRLMALESAGVPLERVRENYFPGMWTRESRGAFNAAMEELGKGIDVNNATPEQKAAIKAQVDRNLEDGTSSETDALAFLARKPMAGKESFRKQKVFGDIMDAAEFGLRPISNNPIDLVMLKLAEMDRSIMAHEYFQALQARDEMRIISPYAEVPEGWMKLNDKYGTIYGAPTVTVPEWIDKAVYGGLIRVAKALGIDHERLMKFPPGPGQSALGLSYQGQDRILSRFGTETSVIAHEIGHQLDLKYGLWNLLTGGERGSERNSPIQRELRAIADETERGKNARKKEEKMAQVMEAYIHAPERMREIAPTVFERFDRFVRSTPELRAFAEIKPGLALKKLTGEKYVGLPILGYRIVPESHGEIANNYLSSSLYNNRYFGTLYKGWMAAANALNQTQLGMGSAFHAGFTTIEAQVSSGANVLKDIYGVLRGNRSAGDLGKSVVNATQAALKTAVTGDQVLNAWRDPEGTINPRIAQVIRAAELAGGGFKMESGLRTEQSAKLVRDWYSEHRLRAAVRSPLALTELMAKPIMDYLVPRQKAGVFADLAWRIIEQNPGKPIEDLAPQFRQAWNRVDARLGQVRYDRLFVNNTAKNVAQGLIRAPGWSGGTIAEIGGGFVDAGKFLTEWAQTGQAPENLPDRTAYVLSLVTTVTAMNAALTYAFTGTAPRGLDYFAFRSGQRDEQGREERFLVPSYMKDILAYARHPGETLFNKAHPLISMISDVLKNKDYYGVEIANPDDNVARQVGQQVEYVVKGFEPFWTRGVRRESQRDAGLLRQAGPFFGIMPAPRSVTQTAAESLAQDLMRAQMPSGARSQAQADRSAAKAATHKGGDYLMQTVKRLNAPAAVRVFQVANARERARIGEEVRQKIRGARSLSAAEREALFDRINGR